MEPLPPAVPLRIAVGSCEVSSLLLRPEGAESLLVMAHGAGAGMTHPFMESIAQRLAGHGIATLRYQFSYMERRTRRPDPPALLKGTVRAAAALAREIGGDLPLLAGGKSMGGRMTSLAASEEPLSGVRGLVFFGFPLHPARRPSTHRGDHLPRVNLPMLFLQGTRDELADLALMRGTCERLGRQATLHVVEGADHSFHVLKTSGRTDSQVLEEMAARVEAWWMRVHAGRNDGLRRPGSLG